MKIIIKKPQMESLVLTYFLLLPVFRDLIFSHIPLGYYLMDLLLIIAVSFCALLNRSRKSEYYDLILVYGLIVLLFVYKFTTDRSIIVWLTRDYGVRHIFIFGGIFGYGVIRIQRDVDQMLDTMKKCGIILGLYYFYKSIEVIRNGYWSFFQFGQYRQSGTNMSWSYGVLLSMCLVGIYILIDNRISFIALLAVGLLGIMVYGSRGTVVAFALGIFLTVLFVNEGKLNFRNYLIIFAFIGFTVFLFSDTGLTIITNWFRVHGLNSRFLSLLTLQQSFEIASSGRARLWAKVIEMIRERPIWGYGVFGERNEVYALGFPWGYSHNIVLEILVSFGLPIGGLIIIGMLIGIVRFFISSKNKKERLIFVIFLTVSFELLFSNSFWLHYGIWCLLGIYVNHFSRHAVTVQASI